MTDVYDRAAETVQRTLQPRPAGKGAPLTLNRPGTGEGAYDPETGTVTGPAASTFNGLAFRGSFAVRDIDGSLIRADDVKFLIAPLQVDGQPMPQPQTTDTISFDGSTYRVQNVWPMNYAGKLVAFKVQGRK